MKTNDPKTILIIGAGIAGLATGCYAQMNGYKTQIFELHTIPGGLCTAWTRKGYTFDGCIHYLVGSSPNSSANVLWRELGAVQGRQFIDEEIFIQVESANGKILKVYTNIDRLEQHMLELSPGDARVIKEFAHAIRKFTQIQMPVKTSDTIKMMGVMPFVFPLMQKYSKISVEDFTSRFSDPTLRDLFRRIYNTRPNFPMLIPIMTLANMHMHNGGFPVGGSREFARSIERRYLSLGGQIHYKSRVEQILVEDDCAVGIRLADGSEYRADIIVSAADGHATIFNMLGGRYINDTIQGYYDHLPIFKPLIQVSLGVARDFSKEPTTVNFSLEKPVTIAGEERTFLGFKHFCADRSMAPVGKSTLVFTIGSNYAYWKSLAGNREHYEAEKQQVAIIVIEQLEKRFPGITQQIEVVDVATPLTYERYTGNWQGSYEGWMVTTKNVAGMMTGKGMNKTLPGLNHFYMTGQWVEPGGGIPASAMSGRKLVKLLCQRDGKRMVTTELCVPLQGISKSTTGFATR
jgi:phytoene dehydrogenase-like protein